MLRDFFSSGSKNGARHSVLEYANIGDVVWGKCDDPSAVPGAECGYAMWVSMLLLRLSFPVLMRPIQSASGLLR